MELFAYLEASARQLMANPQNANLQQSIETAAPGTPPQTDGLQRSHDASAADEPQGSSQRPTPAQNPDWEDDALATSWWV